MIKDIYVLCSDKIKFADLVLRVWKIIVIFFCLFGLFAVLFENVHATLWCLYLFLFVVSFKLYSWHKKL